MTNKKNKKNKKIANIYFAVRPGMGKMSYFR
jgi:hypothetical protein